MTEPTTKPFAPFPDPVKVTTDDFKEPTVTMQFPKDVRMTLEDRRTIDFKKGTREVPISLQNHWYLKANHVTLYAPPELTERADPQFVELAQDLWEVGKLAEFSQFIRDPGPLVKRFETLAHERKLKWEVEQKAEAEAEAKRKEYEAKGPDGGTVPIGGLPSAEDLDTVEGEKVVAAAAPIPGAPEHKHKGKSK